MGIITPFVYTSMSKDISCRCTCAVFSLCSVFCCSLLVSMFNKSWTLIITKEAETIRRSLVKYSDVDVATRSLLSQSPQTTNRVELLWVIHYSSVRSLQLKSYAKKGALTWVDTSRSRTIKTRHFNWSTSFLTANFPNYVSIRNSVTFIRWNVAKQ
jgi:hypothetical protein